MASFFSPTVRETSEGMQLQLDRVRQTGNTATKLTVLGGFADSPYLRSSLRADLHTYNQVRSTDTEDHVLASERKWDRRRHR